MTEQTDQLLEKLDPGAAKQMRKMRAAEGDAAANKLLSKTAHDIAKDYPGLRDSLEQVQFLVPGLGPKRTPELLMKLGLFLKNEEAEVRTAVHDFLVQIGAA